MPPKKCGRCEKTVYPTEELKCLDKVWHKGCFKCQGCNMTLNMKNYKGYNKLPYCNAHYPQTKHTAVADTPEQRRIAENTKIQSNIHYHSDFERERGTYRQVADSLDMKLHLKNTENLSLIKYHEEFEKQKGKKMTIADDPEMQRVRQNMEVISNVAYHGDRDKKYQMEMMRPAEQLHVGPPRHHSGGYQQEEPHTGGTPYSSRNSAGARQVYDSSVGKVEQPSQRKVGSISDYDPMNENYGSITGQGGQGQRRSTGQQPQHQPAPQQYRPPEPVPAPAPQDPRDRYAAKGRRPGRGKTCATAMYDYNAADTDEVSFNEGDIIIDCQDIDAGWMEGTVERTGLRGMLPSNYVEKF